MKLRDSDPNAKELADSSQAKISARWLVTVIEPLLDQFPPWLRQSLKASIYSLNKFSEEK